jgi:hypothetical protein
MTRLIDADLTPTVRPFSRGTEFAFWEDRNCAPEKKAAP